jgi:hypothetical protein
MITRRGKRSIIGVDGVVDEDDYNQFDEPDTDDEADHADGTGVPNPVNNRRKQTTERTYGAPCVALVINGNPNGVMVALSYMCRTCP